VEQREIVSKSGSLRQRGKNRGKYCLWKAETITAVQCSKSYSVEKPSIVANVWFKLCNSKNNSCHRWVTVWRQNTVLSAAPQLTPPSILNTNRRCYNQFQDFLPIKQFSKIFAEINTHLTKYFHKLKKKMILCIYEY